MARAPDHVPEPSLDPPDDEEMDPRVCPHEDVKWDRFLKTDGTPYQNGGDLYFDRMGTCNVCGHEVFRSYIAEPDGEPVKLTDKKLQAQAEHRPWPEGQEYEHED